MATSPLLWSAILSEQQRKMSQYLEFVSLFSKPTLFYLKVPCIDQLQNEKGPRNIAYIANRDKLMIIVFLIPRISPPKSIWSSK